MIPFAAFGLKQYADRSRPVSKMSDNDDATASLGDSEVLSVQYSVGDPIPEFCQRPCDGAHRAAVDSDTSAFAGPTFDSVEFAGAVVPSARSVSSAGADRRQESRDVLANEPSGAKLGQDADDLPPEP